MEIYEENLEGELLYLGPRRICQVRLWKWASVSMGSRFGDHGETLLSQGLREAAEISFFSKRTLIEEFERHVKEGTGNG